MNDIISPPKTVVVRGGVFFLRTRQRLSDKGARCGLVRCTPTQREGKGTEMVLRLVVDNL